MQLLPHLGQGMYPNMRMSSQVDVRILNRAMVSAIHNDFPLFCTVSLRPGNITRYGSMNAAQCAYRPFGAGPFASTRVHFSHSFLLMSNDQCIPNTHKSEPTSRFLSQPPNKYSPEC